MTPGSDCLRVEPQCQLPTFHQSPVVLRPVANLISEGVVAFAHPLAYQGGERWGWSQISATTPYRQIDRAHRDWAQGQLGFIANVVRLYRGEHLDFTLGSDEAQAKIQGVFGKKPEVCRCARSLQGGHGQGDRGAGVVAQPRSLRRRGAW